MLLLALGLFLHEGGLLAVVTLSFQLGLALDLASFLIIGYRLLGFRSATCVRRHLALYDATHTLVADLPAALLLNRQVCGEPKIVPVIGYEFLDFGLRLTAASVKGRKPHSNIQLL